MNQSKNKKAARITFNKLRQEHLIHSEAHIVNQVKLYLKEFYNKNKLKTLIGIYWPLNGEVDLRPLKESIKQPFALPACNGKGELTYHRWTNKLLRKDSYGIPAPLLEPPLKPSEISLLMVPALAIDRKGTRLGYGGGCFDRLRKKSCWKEVKALAIVPNICISKTLLPKDDWDIPFDGWINEKETFQINH